MTIMKVVFKEIKVTVDARSCFPHLLLVLRIWEER